MAKRDTSGSGRSRPKSSGSQAKPNILVIWGDDIGPRQKAASFTIDPAMEKMESVSSGALH